MRKIIDFISEKIRIVKERVALFLSEEDGMGTVEVVLIIVVLVGLVLIFKNQISDIVNGIFETIKSNVDSVSG